MTEPADSDTRPRPGGLIREQGTQEPLSELEGHRPAPPARPASEDGGKDGGERTVDPRDER